MVTLGKGTQKYHVPTKFSQHVRVHGGAILDLSSTQP